MIEKPPEYGEEPKKPEEEKPKLKLDLGCGEFPKEGFEGVDLYTEAAKHRVDLYQFPWPWADNSVDEIHCSHFIEHIPGEVMWPRDSAYPERGFNRFNYRVAFFEELFRIMKVGAKATIIAPYYNNMRATQDPTHVWPPISEATFLYCNKGWREANKLDHAPYPLKCDFDASISFTMDNVWVSKAEETRQFAFRHYSNVIVDIVCVLEKRAPNAPTS